MQKKHKKDYRPSSDGGKNDKTRKELFRARNKQIKKHNSEKAGTFRKELNQFSDLVREIKYSFVSRDLNSLR
jgi:hypothetical protein